MLSTRFRPQFRLAHLGIVVILLSCTFAWMAHVRRQARLEAEALHTVQMIGGVYDRYASPAWKQWLMGEPQHAHISVRFVDLTQSETWGPYGPGGSVVKLHAWEPSRFESLGEAFRTLTEISSLSFEGTRISGHLQKLIPPSNRLTYLSLEQTGVRSDELKMLRNTPNLERLSLRRTPLNDAGMGYVEELPELELLDVSSTDITDEATPYLSRLPKLNVLRLENTRITDAGLEKLRNMKGLEELDLGLTLVTPSSIPVLTRLNLTDRLVVPNRWPEAEIERLRRSLPGCDVSRSPYAITDRSKAGRPR